MSSIKQYTMSKHRPRFRVHASDGTAPTSVFDEKQTVRDHFSQQLAGSTHLFSDLVCTAQTDVCPMTHAHLSESTQYDVLHFIPTLQQVSSQLKKCPQRAFGDDSICSKLFKSHHTLLAQQLFPIVVKSWLHLAPPIQWRGGPLKELLKNKCVSKSLDLYRDIALTDHSGA